MNAASTCPLSIRPMHVDAAVASQWFVMTVHWYGCGFYLRKLNKTMVTFSCTRKQLQGTSYSTNCLIVPCFSVSFSIHAEDFYNFNSQSCYLEEIQKNKIHTGSQLLSSLKSFHLNMFRIPCSKHTKRITSSIKASSSSFGKYQ